MSTTVASAAVALAVVAEARGGGGRGVHVHLTSAHGVSLASHEKSMAAVLRDADGFNLPDGRPISAVSRMRRDTLPLTQTRGFELFELTVDKGRALGVTHFLLGSTPATLARLRHNLSVRYPGCRIVGEFSPPFRPPLPAERAAQDALIRASGAQIVWVGLGTPKQDFEAARVAQDLPVIAIAVGAAFDFSAGTLRIAPRWMTFLGFEWLYRLVSEPRRLWRRYAVNNARFIRAVYVSERRQGGTLGRPFTRRSAR